MKIKARLTPAAETPDQSKAYGFLKPLMIRITAILKSSRRVGRNRDKFLLA
jgi:hypothetical protein